MRTHLVNYGRQEGVHRRRGQVVNVGFWLYRVPRLHILCRVAGHRPVVDGVGDANDEHHRRGMVSRWVCCDRCGDRPDPQGQLDPATATIGARYTGPFDGTRRLKVPLLRQEPPAVYASPGPWGPFPAGELGGQLVLGASHSGVGFSLKVGNAGSEQTLAATFHFGWLGALYLHTERIGVWWQRRLNPVGYSSRIIGIEVDRQRLTWKVWAKRDELSRDDPWWMRGSVRVNPFDLILGPKRFAYENVGAPATATVRMPHGDDHEVTLQLQRQTLGRKRWRKTHSWSVDWDAAAPGIATEAPGCGRIRGSSVPIPDAVVGRYRGPDHQLTQWVPVAAALVAASMAEKRAGYGYESLAATRG